ncbi:SAM-dependent methyltransferase [Aliikangiella maris]|uniref:SAM-dependent methyltransferase n=2 Tax=Aliikangiella maris TaxID=3162458 RepID=A0ABV3MLT8_9GAMM
MGNANLQRKGALTIVGCGLHPGQMTLETQSIIENSQKVLVVAPNALSIHHIQQLNKNVENLGRFYEGDVTRLETYRLMTARMVELVKQGYSICTVFYGHPGIFVLSTHQAFEILRNQGYEVKMLPGISADACLFSDLNIDPSTTGCQSYEATQFLLTQRSFDTSAALILWQIGLVGEHTLKVQSPGEYGLSAMTKLLTKHYPANHQVCLYEAPTLPGFAPRMDWLELTQLPQAEVKSISTLFIPACTDLIFAIERLTWLNLAEEDLSSWDEPIDKEVLN